MKVLRAAGQPQLALICCQHGHEVFGLQVFSYFAVRLAGYPGLVLILANEQAVLEGARYVHADLNRSYPGGPQGNHEEVLAHQIGQEIADVPLVLDIHTTSCDVGLVPLVAELNGTTRRVIGLTEAERVVRVSPEMAAKSLLGIKPEAVALEHNEVLAREEGTLQAIVRLVEDLLAGKPGRGTVRQVYPLLRPLTLDEAVPAGAREFRYSEELQGYPFLLHERSYTDIRGFLAGEPESVRL